MLNKLLTAQDIDNNQKSIESQINLNVSEFVKTLLKKKLKEVRDLKKISGEDGGILSKEEINHIKLEIISGKVVEEFRTNQKQILESKRDNYFILRQTIQDLNELNEFSAEIERNEIQKVKNFLDFRGLTTKSLGFYENYRKVNEIRNKNIILYINEYKNKTLSFKENEEKLLINLQELYKIDKSIDDIDLYERFNMESNIDMSNKLADIYFHKYANGDNNSNLINNSATNLDNPLEKLISTQIISNKNFALLLLSGKHNQRTSFITNNAVTCLKTTYTTTKTNQYIYSTRTLGELLLEITNEKLSYQQKVERQQIYITYDGSRPTVDEYYKWNGLQIFDIDLKLWNGSIDLLKRKLYELLQDFHWFLWICKSASGKGIHIYTKVAPPHHVYIKPSDNEYITKYWYNVNYAHKSSIIYDCLYRLSNDDSNTIKFGLDFENKFLDNVVGRITTGIRLTYDAKPLINNNFMDLHVGLGLSQTLDGFTYQKTINEVLFRETPFHKKLIEKIYGLIVDDPENIIENKSEEIDLTKFITLGTDISKVTAMPRSSINYTVRYNVCNTLAALFGKDGLPLAHTILDSTVCKNVGEINSFYSCAISNIKKPSKMGLDILRKSGVIKHIEPEAKQIIDDVYKNHIKKMIDNSLDNKLIREHIILGKNEYLSDRQEILLDPKKGGLTNSKINIIFSPPGSGKTEWIKKLASDGKRILLVLPYISVIKNKVEIDQELMKIFECYYGSKDIKQIEYGINAVTTFDKFSRSNYDKISKMFDYIFIDESHLLFTSSYRIEATSNVIKKIKELFFISSNDPFAAKLCLLTGTETGESYFFGTVANIIRIHKESLNKSMEFLICDDLLDSITRLACSAAELIQNNHRLLIPTNKGEIYSEKLIGMISSILSRVPKYGYYKRSNTDQEICQLINNHNTIGDYEIVFCSNYLSVGVDINDYKPLAVGSGKTELNSNNNSQKIELNSGENQIKSKNESEDYMKFASIYLGPFSGYEIEQFNARIRRTGIKSIYCIQTQKADGTTSDELLEEPNLLLHITDEDKDNFLDDKQISKAKQEFLAQYDPILHKIVTPGFSFINGKIKFNLEEYELISFENKYNDCMQHPVKVARELSKYGYNISVSTEYIGLSPEKQEELKAIGIEASKNEKIKKHGLLVGTFLELIEQNSYINQHGLEFTDVIGWIGKHPDAIREDRELTKFIEDENNPGTKLEVINYIKIEFDIFATPISVSCRSKEALDLMYKPAKYLISKYSVTKCQEIISQYIDETGILKQKLFKRAINLLKLVDSSDANELADPLAKTLEKMYDFVDKFETNKDYRIGYNLYKATIDEWTNNYIDMLGIKINTQYGYDKLKDSLTEMLADIATKNTSKNGIKFIYNKLPDQDSSSVLNRRSVDSMIERMFAITSDIINGNKANDARNKHIILIQQNF